MAKKKIVHDWMPQDERLNIFYHGINDFIKEYIPENLEQETELKEKIIADPLHGYIKLKSWEVALIDTKLFQRLRKISQLGLANLVFPSLNYSRFEHSLGVLGTVNVLLLKLVENSSDDEKTEIKELISKYEIPLRMAALLHDVGHCLFSHCSERVINSLSGDYEYPSSAEIIDIFTFHFKRNKPIPFAEIFAVSFIGNIYFSEFIERLDMPKSKRNDLPEKLEIAANFILGLPHKRNSKTIFLAQLISSGLDADKIDYMAREALYSGIKLEIDLDRIYSKISVFDVKANQLPENLGHLKEQFNNDSIFKVLGLKKGGQFNFEEFCVSRLALHVKIYLHQKVRAAEAQLGRYLEILSKDTFLEKAHEWLTFPESIIEYEAYILEQLNEKKKNLFETLGRHDSKVAFSKLGKREIVSRAFAFGFTNCISSASGENVVIDDFNKHFKSIDKYRIEGEIYKEYLKLCRLLDMQPYEKIQYEIILDLPRYINIQQGHDSLFFPHPTNLTPKWTIPIDKIMIYYQYNRALAYVFAPREACPLVHIASEIVIYKEMGLVFNNEGVISEGVLEEIKKLKSYLCDKKYYENIPQISPLSKYLNSVDAFEKIQIVLNNLKRFRSHRGDTVSINSITTFINQFPIELQPVSLDFITYLKLYDEDCLTDKINDVINDVINAYGNDNKIGLSYIGNNTDSGSLFPYHLRGKLDFNNEKIMLSDLNDNLIKNCDRIVLFDDNINSGLQLVNVFAELFGVQLPEESRLSESHLFELTDEESKNKLKTIKKYFVFTVGFEGIEEKLKNILFDNFGVEKESVKVFLYEEIKEDNKIFSGKNSPFDSNNKIKLRKFLEKTGEKLLKSENKSDEKIATCKLGYANAESMVVFPYNVPTMTVTALWCEGKVDDRKWIPLVYRRRRSKSGDLIGEDK
ncbi:putative dGTPase [Porphyromonas gingivalis F0185]|uniref:phosphoribosyltransferase-like protein n=1 Tax=Porphyromonas gingivalis TaxID=837 RepID=UPI0003AD1604|nr:HD domain-containing protein [Porphyromonas gingivalis]ERJ84628.1 putative dGTPase [Porphyromonas gingivalis F0185]PDP64176.1 HD domain-containing protein [Porphyromonas gingivalis]